MIKVGVTGGIGSGKTTFCREWEEMGAYVVYADDLAKKLMNENEELRSKIVKVFGEQSYDDSGNLDRSYLAREAFEKGRVEELNELVHPVLWQKVKTLAEEKKREGVEVFAKEAAILLNNGRPKDLDYVIILLADEDNRIKRTKDRDNTSDNAIRERISKQPDFNELIHLADFVITNDGSLEDLKKKAQEVFDVINKQAN